MHACWQSQIQQETPSAKQVVVTRLRKGVFPAMLVVRGLLVLQMSKEAESKGRTMAEAA